MAVYYKFKSAKDFDSIAIDGHFISVANLKEKIFESKHLGRGLDFDLVVTNAQTNEEYLDEAMLIPNNISVLVRRVPGRPRKPIVSQPSKPKIGRKPEDDQPGNSNFTAAKSSVLKDLETSEWDDEFGRDLCATIPEVTLVQSSNPVRDVFPPNKADEDCKIKALIETPALDWQCQATNGFGSGRGHARGGRAMSTRGFGRGGLAKTPPPGYVCHRCRQPGHFIQQCPTNGDPIFGLKKLKLPTGIPKSMLMATPDGSYALPSGDVAVLRPNEAVFEKEIGGLPSTRSVGDFPPELHCSLCKEVMNDAVLTSKCCLESFCDKCIRDHFILKSVCVCGAVDVLADDLLPNKTLRDTINHILESNNNSNADNTGIALQIQDLESARCPQPKIPSSIHSAASKGEQMPPTYMEETPKPKECVAEKQQPVSPSQQDRQPQSLDKKHIANIADASEATHESASAREPASPGSVPPVEEELRQRTDTATDLQWRANQEFPVDNFMTPMGPSAHPPYGFGMQRGIDSFPAPNCGGPGGMPYNMGFNGGMPYNMEFGLGPMDMPLGSAMLPHDPFDEPQGFMFPSMAPPHRHLVDMNMGSLGMNMSTNVSMNNRPPLMSREEFEAQKDNLRRKREDERRVESRERSKARDRGRKVSSDVEDLSMKAKPKPFSRSPSVDSNEYYEKDRVRDRDRIRSRDRDDGHRRYRRSSSYRSVRKSPDSSRNPELSRPSSKRKSEHLQPCEDDDDYDRDRNHERVHRHIRDRTEYSLAKPAPMSSESPSPQSVFTETTSSAASADAAAAVERKKKSVFSRISLVDGEPSKRRKQSSSSKQLKPGSARNHEAVGSGDSGHRHHNHKTGSRFDVAYGYFKSSISTMDYEWSDDGRHFKRKPSRYEQSPPPPVGDCSGGAGGW